MPLPELKKAKAAVAEWIGNDDYFSEEDPYHALRCAAYCLKDAGVLSEVRLYEIIDALHGI